jgi:hypothetical protein
MYFLRTCFHNIITCKLFLYGNEISEITIYNLEQSFKRFSLKNILDIILCGLSLNEILLNTLSSGRGQCILLDEV